MICPKCSFDRTHGGNECPKCGIVFSKFKGGSQQESQSAIQSPAGGVDEASLCSSVRKDPASSISQLFLPFEPDTTSVSFWGRLVLLVILTLWGIRFIVTPIQSNYAGESCLHLINLPFHEAGHLMFLPLGRFMTVLGGSLMQLLVPLICLLTFLLKTRDAFAASVSLWWLGESLMDLAPYINDARELSLMLVGGVTGRDVEDYNDWEYILRELRLLEYDHTFATVARAAGITFMIIAFIWGTASLIRYWRPKLPLRADT